MDKVQVTKDLENNTLRIERTFDAPKEKLWKAYADREWFARWWGPEGWETTLKEFDFKEGGRIHYCMKCVDENQGEFFGQEAWGLIELTTIDEPNKITAMDYFSDESGARSAQMPGQQFIIELVEEGSQTRLVCQSITETPEQLEELVKMGMVEGFSSQLNKLEALVAE